MQQKTLRYIQRQGPLLSAKVSFVRFDSANWTISDDIVIDEFVFESLLFAQFEFEFTIRWVLSGTASLQILFSDTISDTIYQFSVKKLKKLST